MEHLLSKFKISTYDFEISTEQKNYFLLIIFEYSAYAINININDKDVLFIVLELDLNEPFTIYSRFGEMTLKILCTYRHQYPCKKIISMPQPKNGFTIDKYLFGHTPEQNHDKISNIWIACCNDHFVYLCISRNTYMKFIKKMKKMK